MKPAPDQPKHGETVLLCQHEYQTRENPTGPIHYNMAPAGLGFTVIVVDATREPVASKKMRARWLILCDACQTRFDVGMAAPHDFNIQDFFKVQAQPLPFAWHGHKKLMVVDEGKPG